MSTNKYILLTIDLEEFDLPLEHGIFLPPDKQTEISTCGLERVNSLLNEFNIRITYFITARYALANEAVIKKIGLKHEIASHGCNHTVFEVEDPLKSKRVLESISGQTISGFRMPRMTKTDLKIIKSAGYAYDSSVNPTYIPSRYNYLSKPRTFFTDEETGLVVIPVSVSPVIRFPLFWLSFKNLPSGIYNQLCRITLNSDEYLHLYFHSWEFADIRQFKIPGYLKRISGDNFTAEFAGLLNYLKNKGEFITISEFLKIHNLTE